MAQLWDQARWRQKNSLLSVFHARASHKRFWHQHDEKTFWNVQSHSCDSQIGPLQKGINFGNERRVSQENSGCRPYWTVWLGTVLLIEVGDRPDKRGAVFKFRKSSTFCDCKFNWQTKPIVTLFRAKISMGKSRDLKWATYRFQEAVWSTYKWCKDTISDQDDSSADKGWIRKSLGSNGWDWGRNKGWKAWEELKFILFEQVEKFLCNYNAGWSGRWGLVLSEAQGSDHGRPKSCFNMI